MLGNLFSAGASLLGGILGRDSAAEERAQDRALQREFAQSGIQWRVEDAKKAGIHPIYALGGSGATYSPVATSFSDPLAKGIADMGQDIGRAMNTTKTQAERTNSFDEQVRQLSLRKMGLENDLLASQIAKLRQTPNPPMPTVLAPASKVPEASKFEDMPRLALGGAGSWKTDPMVTNAEDYEKRYGEITDFLFGPYALWRDYQYNTGGVLNHIMSTIHERYPNFKPRQDFRTRWDALPPYMQRQRSK